MLHSLIVSSFAFSLLLSTACTIKGKGSQRERFETAPVTGDEGSETLPASDDAAPEGDPACLKLAEKRKHNLKLQDEGEEPVEETMEEAAACPAEEAVPMDPPPEETAEEEVPAAE